MNRNTEHSPTPWRVVHGPARGLVILDAGGEAVAATLDPARQRSEADAAFIVEAVNDYKWAIGEIHKMTVEHDELFDEAVEIRKERDRLREELDVAKAHADSEERWANDYFAQAQKAEAERDRLRDLVRRLVSSLSTHHSAMMMAAMSNRTEFDTPDVRRGIDADSALLREAREAIGEAGND